ncbi:polysaccharide biosynthesis protein [Fictibacillus sp. Mic-4]|uniref:polysaccharide biosynthesis protein n=1 Tax=Fictibacillus TaxID=1329200 RepID=UPI00042059C7|nr:polysaccharide biosynthesis protein [Fictibacillus gelatini]
MDSKLFIKGAIILSLSAFITELLEFVINVCLARALGKEGFGLFMMILPVLGLIMTVAMFELPIAISKLVAEYEEKGQLAGIKRTLKVSLLLSSVISLVLIVLCLIGAYFVNKLSIINFDSFYPVVAILLIIPLLSFSSIFRGYFGGKQRMNPIAIAHILRKLAQLLFIVFVLQYISNAGLEITVTGAILSIAFNELIGLIVLCMKFISAKERNFIKEMMPTKEKIAIIKKIFRISLPTTGSRLVNVLTWAIQPFLITQALQLSGYTSKVATEQFGLLTGVALTIGMFPGFIAHSLATSLIPSISEAYSKNDAFLVQDRIMKAIFVTFIYGIPCTVIMYLLASPLTSLFFHNDNAANYLKLLTPYFFCHYLVVPLQAVLIGLGKAKATMYQNLWTNIASFIMIILLATRPDYGMYGVIIALNFEVLLLTLLHFFSIRSLVTLSLTAKFK